MNEKLVVKNGRKVWIKVFPFKAKKDKRRTYKLCCFHCKTSISPEDAKKYRYKGKPLCEDCYSDVWDTYESKPEGEMFECEQCGAILTSSAGYCFNCRTW